MTFTGVLVLTPDTLLVRLTAIDDFSMAVGRGLTAGATILLLCLVYYRGNFPRQLHVIGMWGLVVAVLYGGANITFYAALERTSVADVLVILATTPLVAAILSRVILQERVARVTAVTIVFAFLGVVLVVGGSVGAGRWAGDLLALGNVVAIALVLVVVRRHREISMVPATGVGMILGGVAAIPFADFPHMAGAQWAWLLAGGIVVLPAAFILLTLGPRYIPAPEAGLLMLLETALGPLWVWAAIGEEPGMLTLVGGGIVVCTLAIHAVWRLRPVSIDAIA